MFHLIKRWKGHGEEKKMSAHDPKHTSSLVKDRGDSVIAWACMTASEADSLIFTDDGTGWQQQNDFRSLQK